MGAGTVTANISSFATPDCQVSLILNGRATNSIQVEDGDPIKVEIQAIGNCTCCETKIDCISASQSAGLWMSGRGKENNSIVMNKSALEQKIKFVLERIKKRKRGLGRNY